MKVIPQLCTDTFKFHLKLWKNQFVSYHTIPNETVTCCQTQDGRKQLEVSCRGKAGWYYNILHLQHFS